MLDSINWPAILIIDNDELLYYLESANDLLSELQQHYLSSADSCNLLELSGQKHLLNTSDTHHPTSQLSNNLDLTLFNQMVRNHLSARQQCCVLKITLASFDQGFELVRNTSDD